MAGSTGIVGEQLYPLSQSILPQVKLPEWTLPAQLYFRLTDFADPGNSTKCQC